MRNYNPKEMATFPISNGYAPGIDEGPKTLPLKLDFTLDGDIYVDAGDQQRQRKISIIQAIWVDNTANAAALTITSRITGQTMVVPARAVVTQPLFVGDPCQLLFSTTQGAFVVNAQLLNVPMAPSQMGPVTVNVSLTSTGTFTAAADSTLNVGGNSQQLFAANANRKGWIIQNPSSEMESLFIDFGGAATNGSPSIELTPGSFLPQSAITTQEIQWNATTLGHTINAKELA